MLTESKRMAGVYGIEHLALSADLANEYVSQTAIEARRFLSSEHRAMEEQHEAIRLPKPAPAQNQEVKLFGDFDHRGGPSPERCRPGAEVGRRASRPASGGKDFAPVDTVATLESA